MSFGNIQSKFSTIFVHLPNVCSDGSKDPTTNTCGKLPQHPEPNPGSARGPKQNNSVSTSSIPGKHRKISEKFYNFLTSFLERLKNRDINRIDDKQLCFSVRPGSTFLEQSCRLKWENIGFTLSHFTENKEKSKLWR